MTVLLDIEFLAENLFSLCTRFMYIILLPSGIQFLLRHPLLILLRIHFAWWISSRCCQDSVIMMCLGEDYFEFILPGICCTSWLCRLILSTHLRSLGSVFSFVCVCVCVCVCVLLCVDPGIAHARQTLCHWAVSQPCTLFLQVISLPPCPLPTWSLTVGMLIYLRMSQRSLGLCSFFFSLFFFFVYQTGYSQLTYFKILWLFFLPA
jgi:hypothetical protein